MYNLKEYAAGSVYDRHKFHDIENLPDYKGQREIYASMYNHSEEIQNYFNTNKNLQGYSGSVGIDTIVIDMDLETDLNEALNIFRNFIRHLEAEYEVDLSALRINFSGNKGFHLRMPAELFGGFEPSEELPSLVGTIVKKLTDGFEHFDTGIYDTIRLIRIPNTINGKSKLFAIPLTVNEIFSLSIDEIKELAKSTREIECLDPDELHQNKNLVELKSSNFGKTPDSSGKPTDANEIQIKDLLKGGLVPSQRHHGMKKIVGHLIHFGVPDYSIIELMKHWNKSNKPAKPEDDLLKEVNGVIKFYAPIEGDFWTIKKSKNGRVITLKHSRLLNMLEEQGYGKIYLKKSLVFIKEKNKRIVEVVTEQMRDGILKYVRTYPSDKLLTIHKNKILDMIIAKNASIMGDGVLELIKTNELNLLKDTIDKGYMFFDNGIVEITKNGPQIKTYDEVNGLTWDDQINKRSISIIDEYKSEDDESAFGKFVWNISGRNTDRFYSIVSGIGYMLHSYKDASSAKAVVFCDEKISDDPNGRTGKSLISKAISKIKESIRVDGKSVNFKDKFTYQQVELSTQIIEFNDVRRNFDFESLFSIITDSINVEKKNGHKFAIEFEDAPKILISTNFTIKGNGDSFTDRLFEVEFSDYYNAKHKPIDDFGKRFFDEWDEIEWNRFDNFMLMCEQFYLEHGLVEYEKINLIIRKLMDNTSPEFISYAGTIQTNTEYEKNQTYSKFTEFYPDFSHIKQRTFSQWLKIYADNKGYEFETRKSNSKDYFCFAEDNRKSLFG